MAGNNAESNIRNISIEYKKMTSQDAAGATTLPMVILYNPG
jgi:hypothetical protein